MATTIVNATCACNAFNLQVEYPNSSLPFERSLCLCNACRRVTGSCAVSTLPIPSSQKFDPTLFKLTAYTTSPLSTRYFCSTCGAHVVLHHTFDNSWHFMSGLSDRLDGIVKWTGFEWLEDTLDGGISVWLKTIKDSDGTEVPLKNWLRYDSGQPIPKDGLKFLSKEKDKTPTNRLHAQCHCGGVKFHITRPDELSKKARSPFPDLMVPYHLQSSGTPSENLNNETWWLQADGTKYLAGTCTCTSCRVASGLVIQPWAFVPQCNIFKDDGQSFDFRVGTLKSYPSSKGVLREFCGVCGATVFWHCDWRPDLVDVSVGLLDLEEGARAEDWLVWWKGRVSFRELSNSGNLVAALEDGLATV